MQELYIGTHVGSDELGTAHTFHYFLLTDTTTYETVPCPDYGVMVRTDAMEEVRIHHVTTEYPRIAQLLSLLQTNGVSPSHLRDIIDDWL